MAALFLGIDVGTSGTKALLVDRLGRVAATTITDHPSLFPKPGWSEQRPGDWWMSVCKAERGALRKAQVAGSDVAGVGLSGQMHGSVFLDRQRRVLRNALLWNDQRTTAECIEIEQRAGGRARLIRLVQNIALTGYQAPKVLWLRRHEPHVFRQVHTVLLPKDYIRYRLTETLGSDVSDASGTLLFDVAARRWSTRLMERLELDPDWFPPAAESPEVIGTLTTAAARATGLKRDTPVVAGAGDQAAAAVGTGVVRSGAVSATLGTSGVVFAHSPQPVPNHEGLLQSFCHAVPEAWCVFGCMLSAGGSLQWAREVLFADRLHAARDDNEHDAIYDDMIKEAATATGRDPLLFHPYLTGERCPYAHPHACGALSGLTRRHDRGDIIRAVLEGITLGMNRQLELMRASGLRAREVRLAGGGARSTWWRQLQADVYGRPCVSLRSEEGSALGAALLAAVGVGHFPNVPAACAAAVRTQRTYHPVAARTEHYRHLAKLAARTYEALEPLYRREFNRLHKRGQSN
ncbi:MAG: xylulokinase [Planctomycetes bacterium]|nr:xylulokinase [Planctomycetota bacterium]